MAYRFSPSTLGFYETAIHGEAIPADAVYVAPSRHAELMAAQADGSRIAASPETGNPVIVAPPAVPVEAIRQALGSAVSQEAARRMGGTRDIWLALASLHQAVAAGTPPPAELGTRLGAVEDIADREAVLATELEQASDPATFDYRSDNRWETEPV